MKLQRSGIPDDGEPYAAHDWNRLLRKLRWIGRRTRLNASNLR